MFCEDNFISGSHYLERMVSVFEGNVSSLTFAAHSRNESSLENKEAFCHSPNRERCLHDTSSTDLAAEANEHVACCSVFKDSELVHYASYTMLSIALQFQFLFLYCSFITISSYLCIPLTSFDFAVS